MIATEDLNRLPEGNRAVALGFFDGVHLGHQAVVQAAVEAAALQKLRSCVFTFLPSGTLPGSKAGLTLLQTEQQKEKILDSLGVQEMLSPPFDSFMGLAPRAFVEDLLYRKLGARILVCGDNYHFGKAAAGDLTLLRQLAQPMGIRVIAVPPVTWEDEIISSTRIRAALRQGNAEQVTAMLGCPFAIQGEVLHGKGLGRRLSSPTVNQSIPSGFTIPANGVYLSRVSLEGSVACWGVTNIGRRPTVAGQDINCETYLLDFSGDLYGQRLSTALIHYLRPEQRFESLEALSRQIAGDVAQARDWIKKLEA